MKITSKLSLLLTLVLVFQLILPTTAIYASDSEIQNPEIQSPENLRYEILNGNDIRLRWNEAANATSYQVYQIVDGERKLLSTRTTLSYTLTNRPEGSYVFEVTSSSDKFGESTIASQITVELVHPELQAPENLRFEILNGNDIRLRWNESEFATAYNVYQIVDGERKLLSTRTTLSYTLTNRPESSYVFELTSISDRFGESTLSSQITVELDHPELQAPENLRFEILNGNDIRLRWNEVEHATAYDVYQLVNGERKLITTRTSLNYTFRDMPAGSYTFEVTSFSDRFGESTLSSQITVELGHPELQAPENLRFEILNGNDIRLRWNEVEHATVYDVYQIVNGERKLITTRTTLSYTLTNLPAGEYTFEVTAYSDRFGESAPAILSMELISDEMKAPENLRYDILNGNDLRLRWNESEFATAYHVYQIVNGERKLIATRTSLSFTVTNMSAGEYTFEVTAYSDRFGESAGSILNVSLNQLELKAPGNLRFDILNGSDIRLRWNESEFATAYNVYQIVNGERNLIATRTTLNYTFVNMSAGVHTFEVTAYSDRFGESEGSIINVNLSQYEMQSPGNLRFDILNGNDIRLRWNEVELATAYRVYHIVEGERKLIAERTQLNYTFGNMPAGVYTFEVTSFSDRFGESEGAHINVTLVLPEVEVPVLTLQSFIEQTAVLAWNKISDANSYNVYQFTSNGPILLGNTTKMNFTITNLSDGSHEYVVTAVHDRFGESKLSNIVTVEVQSDTTPPVTISNITADWLNSSYHVQLTATDEKSGVDKTFYSINDSEFVEGISFTITEEGVHTTSFYSIDKAGNMEEVNQEEVKIDLTAPLTTSNVPEQWLKEDFTILLTATDNLSGVDKTFNSINGSEFVEGTSFTITEEGVHTISFYSIDVAGNVEAVNTVEVKIDTTPPTVLWDLEEEYSLGSELEINYSASDNLSGIAHEEIRINGVLKAKGDVMTFEQPGQYEIEVTVIDNAAWTTKLHKTVIIYVPVNVEVLPRVINNKTGEFTVKATLPAEFASGTFVVESVTFDGQSPITNNNGLYKQAEKGQFKFHRSDFSFALGESIIEFRAVVDGKVVIGYAKVVTKK